MQTSTVPWLLGAILCVQLAGFHTLWQQNNAKAAQAVPGTRDSGGKAAQATANPGDANRAEIAALLRGILREELAKAAGRRDEAETQARAPAPVIDPVQNQEALGRSVTIIDNALAAGRWRQHDNLAIMQLAPRLTQEQRIALLEKLGDAINGGVLDLEATPPPL